MFPPYVDTEPSKVYEVVDAAPGGKTLTFVISGPDFDTGEIASTTILVPMGDGADAVGRLEDAGLTVTVEDGQAKIEEPLPQTPFFESIGKQFDFYADDPVVISNVREEAERMPKEVFYIPALLVLAVIFLSQRSRRRAKPETQPEAAASA
jgi:hypothetical protein